MPLDAEGLALVFGVFLVCGFVKGVAGLGFSTVGLALIAGFVDPALAIALVIIPAGASTVYVIATAGHLLESLRRFGWMYVLSLPGIAGGLAVLQVADARAIRLALGVVLLVYAVFSLVNPHFRLREGPARWLAPPVGAATGFVNGLTGCQVIPLIPYLFALDLDRDRFVQAANLSFMAGSLTMAAGLGAIGILDAAVLKFSVVTGIPVAIAVWVGIRVRARISTTWFRRLVLGVLMLLGLRLVILG